MLKKFFDGLIFGCGFAFALAVFWTVWTIGMAYVMPRFMDSVATATREPEFKRPVDAQVVDPVPGGARREGIQFLQALRGADENPSGRRDPGDVAHGHP